MSQQKVMSDNYGKQGSLGFAVIELIVVIPILIVITSFLAYLILYQYWVFSTQSTEIAISNSARSALDTIDNYTRGSNKVLSSYAPSYFTGSQTLVLQMPAIDSTSTIISGTYDTVVFYLSGTDLMMNIFPGSGSSRVTGAKKLASDINTGSFGFTYDNASYSLVKTVTTTISITSTVKTPVGSQTRSITLSSKAKLRDYQ